MSTEQRYSLSGATMGTRYSAVFYAAESIDQSALQAELQQAVDRVDRQMSPWQADSDLMRLNAAPQGQWVELPEELLWVLATALQIGEQSGGAFDIGVGALVSACTVRAAASLLTGDRNSYKRVKSESALLVHFNSMRAAPTTPDRCSGSPPRLARTGDQ